MSQRPASATRSAKETGTCVLSSLVFRRWDWRSRERVNDDGRYKAGQRKKVTMGTHQPKNLTLSPVFLVDRLDRRQR